MAHVCALRVGESKFCSRTCKYLAARVEIKDAFWQKVRKTDSCWFWTGSSDEHGYGTLNTRRSHPKIQKAHRISWELANGPIPPGLWVLHKCDTPPCVRPDHLFLGNRSDNMKDAASKGRLDQQKRPLARRAAVAKITPEIVREIRRAAIGADSYAQLSRQFNLTATHISYIVRRMVWKDIGDAHVVP